MAELVKSFHEWKQAHIAEQGLTHVRSWYWAEYGKYCRKQLEAAANKTPRVEFHNGTLRVVPGNFLRTEGRE